MANDLINYAEQMKQDAQGYADEEVVASGFISTKSGVLSWGDTPLPGNQMAVIILDAIHENTIYEDDYDSEKTSPPICFALNRRERELAPHPSMKGSKHFFPQNEDCFTCPFNEWGSADKGKGKACQNRRRLMLIPAGVSMQEDGEWVVDLYDEDKAFTDSDMAMMKLPVTSTTHWAKYVASLNNSVRRPPYGVVTLIWLEPDPKTQYKVCFEMLEQVPDGLLPAIMSRHEESREKIEEPYSEPDQEDQKGRKGVRQSLKKH